MSDCNYSSIGKVVRKVLAMGLIFSGVLVGTNYLFYYNTHYKSNGVEVFQKTDGFFGHT